MILPECIEGLGWRGISALLMMAADATILSFRVNFIPFSLRAHWAAEGVWLFISFNCIALGLPELCGVAVQWCGPREISKDTSGLKQQPVDPMTMIFMALAVVHAASACSGPSAQRRRLSLLVLSISANTAVAYHLLQHEHLLLTSTYGRLHDPLRNVLWAHTSPAIMLVISGPSSPPMRATNLVHTRLIIGIMLSGLVATLPVPSAILQLAGNVGVWAWRLGWLGASCMCWVLVLYLMCRLILSQSATPFWGQVALCVLVVTTWATFPTIWCLAQSHMISETLERTLLALSDFAAKVVATVVLMHNSNVAAETMYQERQQTLLEQARVKAGVLQTFAQSMGHDLRTPLQALAFSSRPTALSSSACP